MEISVPMENGGKRMRLIDADRLQFEADRFFRNEDRVLRDLTSLICMMPTIESEPVKHGRWIAKTGRAMCSVCADECWADSALEYNYCPNCGAKMDLEVDE